MSPEISQANQVRWRMAIADHRWREALALVRQAAALPGYRGPDVQAVEQVAASIAGILDQVQGWHVEEQVRRASRPKRATPRESRAIRKAIAEARRPLQRSRSRKEVIAELYGRR